MRNINELLNQKTLFDEYIALSQHELSSHHFSSIFLWQDFFNFEFQMIHKSLCIFAHSKGASFLYLPPLSKQFDETVVDQCFEKMNQINPRTARIENVEQKDIECFNDQYKKYPKLSEYVYNKEDLVSLKGHAYKSQRHDIHHFESHHQSLLRCYSKDDSKACLELYTRWAKNRYEKHADGIYRSMLEENEKVHELALIHVQSLGLVGYVVEIDKKIIAYSLGYMLNSKTFCVLLEITDPQVTGLSSFIFNRFCASQELRQSILINTMDDFGLPFVASSKQAYHPMVKPVSYTVTQIQ